MDERVSSINNTIDTCMNIKDTCIKDLKDLISSELYEKCHAFIKKIRQYRHKTIQERQIRKFNQMCHQNKVGHSNHPGGCSNYHTTTEAQKLKQYQQQPTKQDQTTTDATTRQKWVKNLLGVPLTKAQASLLTHGPNLQWYPDTPHGDYISAVEQALLNLEPHHAEKLRAEIRGALKHSHSPGITSVRKKPSPLQN